jgi:hypothetical protein
MISFTGYETWEQLEPSSNEPAEGVKAAMKALGSATPEALTAALQPLRDVVRSEIWHFAAGATRTPEMAPKEGDYVVVSYLKAQPGKTDDYIDMWKRIFPSDPGRAHQARQVEVLEPLDCWSRRNGGQLRLGRVAAIWLVQRHPA